MVWPLCPVSRALLHLTQNLLSFWICGCRSASSPAASSLDSGLAVVPSSEPFQMAGLYGDSEDEDLAQVGSLLDTIMLAEWEERAQRGLFRYDVTCCPTKTVPGAYGFIAQFNEGRLSKKRPTEFRIDQVCMRCCNGRAPEHRQ